MKTSITVLMMLVLSSGLVYGQDSVPPPTPGEEQPEVLTRGPVHEAYAEPVDLQVQEGLVVPDEPPANIAENPPMERPVGDQFVWVPGYWAWDSDRNGYIWVSGCWRATPPKMNWVPGYWARIPGGWQWVSGFWTPRGVDQIEYLPAPPALEDVEPVGLAPSPDRIWVPPCWYRYQGQYIRRNGYWLSAQTDWVWAPSHYVWTPRGYIFVAGHWDYDLGNRGVLFAPVYFPRHVYERPGFSYSLSVVVDLGNVQLGLFTYPRYNHFYFGDYYDNIYIGIGIFPRYECERRRTWYDPIYVHDRWSHHRDRPDWDDYQRHEYERRRDDRDLRPPRTYREMEVRQAKLPESKRREFQIAEPMSRIVTEKNRPMKFEPIKADARQKLSKQTTDVRKFSDDRSRWESSKAQKTDDRVNVTKDRGPSSANPMEGRQKTEEKGRAVSPPSKGMEDKGQKADDRVNVTKDRGPSPDSATEGRQKAEDKGKTINPQSQPDRVAIPKSPVSDRRGGMDFFRKNPPSKPADEQKTDSKETRVDKGKQKADSKDTQKGGDKRGSREGRGRDK